MDELVVVIMGVFIANYKVEEHPVFTSCVKAFLIALLCFLWFTIKDFMDNAFTLSTLKFSFVICTGFFVVFSLFLILVEFIFKGRK